MLEAWPLKINSGAILQSPEEAIHTQFPRKVQAVRPDALSAVRFKLVAQNRKNLVGHMATRSKRSPSSAAQPV
jgi:hypothetical protein